MTHSSLRITTVIYYDIKEQLFTDDSDKLLHDNNIIIKIMKTKRYIKLLIFSWYKMYLILYSTYL